MINNDTYKQNNIRLVGNFKEKSFTMLPVALTEDGTVKDGAVRLYSEMLYQAFKCKQNNQYLTTQTLCDRLGIKEATLYRRMNNLEERGWIKRETDEINYKGKAAKYTKYSLYALSPLCEVAQEEKTIRDMQAEYVESLLRDEEAREQAVNTVPEADTIAMLLGISTREIDATCYIYGICGSKKDQFMQNLKTIQQHSPTATISRDTLGKLADMFSADSQQNLEEIAEPRLIIGEA